MWTKWLISDGTRRISMFIPTTNGRRYALIGHRIIRIVFIDGGTRKVICFFLFMKLLIGTLFCCLFAVTKCLEANAQVKTNQIWKNMKKNEMASLFSYRRCLQRV